jgi:NAD(P)-dependent dehydrogenase (short-subunit alcohol dehydrogenase family)
MRGQTALVAGGSSGIGLAIARQLCVDGFEVDMCIQKLYNSSTVKEQNYGN